MLLMLLNIVSLNVRGLRDRVKCMNVISWVTTLPIDVVMLQETYLGSDDFIVFRSGWEGSVFFSPAPSSHSCGVLLAFSPKVKASFSQVRHDSEGRCVSVLCTFLNSTAVRFCNVYSPCNPKDRTAFFQNLFLYTRGNSPLVLGGDFNCVMSDDDRSSNSTNTSTFTGRDDLSNVIVSCKMVDSWLVLHSSIDGHTWKHPGKGFTSRIDRIYVPRSCVVTYSDVLNFPFSDHDAVKVVVDNLSARSHSCYWKCNISVLNDTLFQRDFREKYLLWRTLIPGFQTIVEWWEEIKVRIKGLCIKHGVRIARVKRRKLSLLQNLCLSGDSELVLETLADIGRGARVRARVKELEDGENSSSFFCRKEKARAQSKAISKVRDLSGRVVEGEGITKVFHSFYSELFAEGPGNLEGAGQFLDCIESCVEEADLVNLDQPIVLKEVHEAVMSMSGNKSPGIDGLPSEFYKVFFDLLGPDLVLLYNTVFDNELLSVSQRTAVITLLPKKGDPLDPGNRRPISLLTVDYKIVAKVLQIRLSKVMSSVVGGCQTCAIPGRTIHENLFLIRDIIDYIKVKGGSCALISLDQHKAFDKVNWAFLLQVLGRMGFGPSFCKWVRILYRNICSRIIVNDLLSDKVVINRGVRQGCPLSPLLYVLFIEPLARFIAHHKGIRGLSLPGSGGLTVKFLQYADDATCIASCPRDVKEFFAVMQLFEKASGASLNLSKTCGLKLGDFVGRKLPASIQWSDVCIRITGVVFGSSYSVNSNWQAKLEKAESRLRDWGGRHLTVTGKVRVLNTVVFPLFYFLAPVFPVPDYVVSKVEKMSFNFLWSGKTELVARKVLVLNKEEGGLGLDDFSIKLQALLVKPILRICAVTPHVPCYYLIRYFIAKPLRSFFPELWCNSKPNGDECSGSLQVGCKIIKKLCLSVDGLSLGSFTTKFVAGQLGGEGVTPSIVRKFPSRPWVSIWKSVFAPLLESKLVDFQWRLAHSVLVTGEKVRSWKRRRGIHLLGGSAHGNEERLRRWKWNRGLCLVPGCRTVETTSHIFWDCPRVSEILSWIKELVNVLARGNIFSKNLFMLGAPVPQLRRATFHRIWYVLCVMKWFVWRYRCLVVYESRLVPINDIKSSICNYIKLRIQADFHRLTEASFKEIWLDGDSIVTLHRGALVYKSCLG